MGPSGGVAAWALLLIAVPHLCLEISGEEGGGTGNANGKVKNSQRMLFPGDEHIER